MKPYFKEIIKQTKPSLIVFLHAAEQDAVEVKYLIHELEKKYGDKLTIQRVDSSYNHHIANEYRLSAYPTWVIFTEGQELMRENGIKKIGELTDMIDRAF